MTDTVPMSVDELLDLIAASATDAAARQRLRWMQWVDYWDGDVGVMHMRTGRITWRNTQDDMWPVRHWWCPLEEPHHG